MSLKLPTPYSNRVSVTITGPTSATTTNCTKTETVNGVPTAINFNNATALKLSFEVRLVSLHYLFCSHNFSQFNIFQLKFKCIFCSFQAENCIYRNVSIAVVKKMVVT